MQLYMWILLAVLIVIIGLACTIYFSARYFFRLTILRKPTATLENSINANTNWEPHLDFINERKEWLSQQKMEDVFIKSDDGLKLHATLLRNKSNKNCVICFHGYTSKGLNDYGSISKFYIEQGFNMLLVDHMTMDAQAIVMFFKDIIQIYCHKVYDIDYPKPLASFIKALEKDLKYEADSKALQKDREYWTEVLKQGEPMYADMTGDNLLERQREERNNPNLRAAVCGIQSCDAEIAQFHLEPNPSDWLVTFCEKNNISMATLLLMALRTYLQKVNNNQTDILVQNTVSRRATLAEKNSGGTRIHFFPCRTIVNLDETFLEGCYKIRDAQNAVFRHARYCHKN